MILKALTRHNPSYLNLAKYLSQERKSVTPFTFTHNLRSTDPEGVVKEFIENEAFRKRPRKDQIYLYHEIINFSNLDSVNITYEMLLDIGRKYIELRNNKALYYASIHTDKPCKHIHFMTSATELITGKANRISLSRLREVKLLLQDYHLQTYPEIQNSICAHGLSKKFIKDKEFHKTNRITMKTAIKETVEKCLQQAKTQKQFLELLRNEQLFHYERTTNEPTGIISGNSKFRFSSLDLDMARLNSLPLDISEEEKALQEIRAIREGRQENSKDRILRFEEHGKTIISNGESQEKTWKDSKGITQDEHSDLTENEKESFERMYDFMELYETGAFNEENNVNPESFNLDEFDDMVR